jgi:pimeloyl-ACP methyl ester carboxylesterase
MTVERTSVRGAGGVEIGLHTEGTGPPLLLVHGGMGSATRWAPLWPLLTVRYEVTAMDRRGRGTSGDGAGYSLPDEYGDVLAVAEHLAADHPAGVDVFAHSIGAVCALGAAACGAPFRRLAVHEPPGPETVSEEWVERASGWLENGQVGRAVVSFLVEIIGLDPAAVAALRDTPTAAESMAIAVTTLRREATALLALDPEGPAGRVEHPVLFLLGERSPTWASVHTGRLHRALTNSAVVDLPGLGHDAVDVDPALVVSCLDRFFASG